MKFWSQYPLLRAFLPFLSGIIFVLAAGFHRLIPLYLLIVPACLLLCAAYLLFRFINYRYRWVFGVLCSACFFFLGVYLTIDKKEINHASHFSKKKQKDQVIIAQVCEFPQIKEKSVKLIVQIQGTLSGNKFSHTTGHALAYLFKDSSSLNIEYGDRILLRNKFEKVKGQGNPYEFDYKKYLEYRNIYHRAFFSAKEWLRLSAVKKKRASGIIYYSGKARQRMMQIFEQNGLSGREYAVASALILGYTDHLDPETMSDFAGTGAMHILSVSGLHVGIIFIVMGFILSFLDKNRVGRVIKSFFLLTFIWFYALITGLSPPVLRAAIMISILIIGKLIRKDTGIYNSLIFSAFILLLFNPFNLANVGFQLTFLAVGGIAFVNPYISKLWTPMVWPRLKTKNKIKLKVKKIISLVVDNNWSIISVSIAAQLMTCPIGLYYFHQFPLCFLITNLIVIPLSTLIIYLGVLILCIFPIPLLPIYLTRAFAFLIKCMNQVIHKLEQLPYSSIQGISVSGFETILLYIIILFLILYLFEKKLQLLKFMLIASIIFLSSLTVRKFQALTQKKMIIYNIRNGTLVEFIAGKTAFLSGDSATLKNIHSYEAILKNSHNNLRIRQCIGVPFNTDMLSEKEHFLKKAGWVQFSSKRLVIISDKPEVMGNRKLKTDFILIHGNPKLSLTEILRLYDTRMVILSSNCSNRTIRKITKDADKIHMAVYPVRKQGAFVAQMAN